MGLKLWFLTKRKLEKDCARFREAMLEERGKKSHLYDVIKDVERSKTQLEWQVSDLTQELEELRAEYDTLKAAAPVGRLLNELNTALERERND